MAWLTEEEFKNFYKDVQGESDSTVAEWLANAIAEITRLIGEEKAAAVAIAGDLSDVMVVSARKAQRYFARVAYLGDQITIVEQERDENETVANKYRSAKDILLLQESLRAKALEELEIYKLPTVAAAEDETLNFSVTLSKKAVW